MTRRGVAVALVHVLLAALALTAVAVWGAGADPELADQHVTAPDPDPRLPVAESVVLVRPPGRLVLNSTVTKHGDSPAVLGEVEADILTKAGVVRVQAMVSRDGDLSRGVWQLAVRDGDDPRAALRVVDRLYADGGWTPVPTATRGVLVRTQAPSEAQPFAIYRAHYVRGPYVIRVEAYGTDEDAVGREFAALAERQLAEWPPR